MVIDKANGTFAATTPHAPRMMRPRGASVLPHCALNPIFDIPVEMGEKFVAVFSFNLSPDCFQSRVS